MLKTRSRGGVVGGKMIHQLLTPKFTTVIHYQTTLERKNIALEWIFEYIPFGGLGVSSSS
jgi:hypothetical protein